MPVKIPTNLVKTYWDPEGKTGGVFRAIAQLGGVIDPAAQPSLLPNGVLPIGSGSVGQYNYPSTKCEGRSNLEPQMHQRFLTI